MKKNITLVQLLTLLCFSAGAQNVGIGTTTPVSKLTIQTPINTTGWTHIGGEDLIIVSSGIGGVSASLGTQTDHTFRLNTGGTGKLHIYPDGEVVIGTNSSSAFGKLTVETTNNNYGISHTSVEGNILATRIGGTSAGIGTFSATNMRIFSNGLSRIFIAESSGNIGIGTDNPNVMLQVKGTQNIYSGGDSHTGDFWAGNSNLDGIELVSSGGDAWVGIQRTFGSPLLISKQHVGNNQNLVEFWVAGSNIGRIYSINGFGTTYGTTSDARLKENFVSTQYGLATIMRINVKDYNYISDGKKTLQTGFIAQELYEIYPEAVKPGSDDAKTDPWMVDYSKLTPMLVKAVQEQQLMIGELKKEIEALKKININK